MTSSLKLTTLAAAVFMATSAYATTNSTIPMTDNHGWFPMLPRVLVDGSVNDFGLFEGDAMVPVYGQSTQIMYGDVDGAYRTDDAWYGSLGAGYRGLFNNTIWGGYVFGERDETANNFNFWLVNPGIEVFTNAWDGHINGYFPVGDREKVQGTFFADQVGEPQLIRFEDHNQFDDVFEKVTEVGPGADAEVGYSLLHSNRTRLFLGGYFYSLKHADNIQGIEGGVEVPLDRHATLILKDSYDNEFHNTAMLTLRLRFGGTAPQDQQSVADRILDPIQRHISLVNESSANLGVPSERQLIDTGEDKIERDNIYFFDADSGTTFDASLGTNQCTIAHPCIGTSFTQNTVNSLNTIAPKTIFYFNPGVYNSFPAPTPKPVMSQAVADSDAITIDNGQTLFGRTDDYKQSAATNGDLPQFDGGFNLLSNNTLDAMHIVRTDGGIGVTIENASNATLNQDVIDVSKSNTGNGLQVTGNRFNVLEDGDASPVIGVAMDNAQNINITNSTINVSDSEANEAGGSKSALVGGVAAFGGSSLTMTGNTVNVDAATAVDIAGGTNSAEAAGVAIENSAGTLNQNHINVTTYGTVFTGGTSFSDLSRVTATGVGIHVESNDGQSASLTSEGNTVIMNNTAEVNSTQINPLFFAVAQTIRDRDLEIESADTGSQTNVTSTEDNFTSTNSATVSGVENDAISGGNVSSNNNLNTGNVGLFATANDSGVVKTHTTNSNFSSDNNATANSSENFSGDSSAVAGGNLIANNNINAGNAGLFAQANNSGSIIVETTGSNFSNKNNATTNVDSGDAFFAYTVTGGNAGSSDNNINAGNAGLFASADNNAAVTINTTGSTFSSDNEATSNTSGVGHITYVLSGGNLNGSANDTNMGNAGLFAAADNGGVITINSSGNNFNSTNIATANASGDSTSAFAVSGGNVESGSNANFDNAALFADSRNNGAVNVTANDNTFTASAVGTANGGLTFNESINSLFGVFANGAGTTVDIDSNTFNLTSPPPNLPIGICTDPLICNGNVNADAATTNTFNINP